MSGINVLLRRLRHLDPWAMGVGIVATLISVVSYIHYLHRGVILAYVDSMSHLLISRRIIDSPTPGISASGGVWPALIHWAMAMVLLVSQPFDPDHWLYYSGTAGSLISMSCFVATAVLLYLTSRLLTEAIFGSIHISRISSLASPAVFLVNPNVVYMQATPMTELPLILGTVLAVYCLLKWSQRQTIGYLIGVIIAVFWASGTRYEGWALWATIVPVVAYVAFTSARAASSALPPIDDQYQSNYDSSPISSATPWIISLDYVTYYAIFAGLFIPGWMAWNKFIIRTGWLGFIHSEYASPANWVRTDEPSLWHPWLAARTYWLAMVHINGHPIIALGAIGLAILLLTCWLNPQVVGVYVLLYPFPFFWLMLWSGQRPLHVPEISGDRYNVRFALQTIPFFALMAGVVMAFVLRQLRRWPVSTIVVLISIAAIAVATPSENITLDEPVIARESIAAIHDQQTAQWLRTHYTTGAVLMATPGNEEILFDSHLPLGQVIYEGTNSRQIWQQALSHPDQYVDWVFMRRTAGSQDKVFAALGNNPGALRHFSLVYQTPDILIYHRVPGATARSAPT